MKYYLISFIFVILLLLLTGCNRSSNFNYSKEKELRDNYLSDNGDSGDTIASSVDISKYSVSNMEPIELTDNDSNFILIAYLICIGLIQIIIHILLYC
jgi:hypothetical protein